MANLMLKAISEAFEADTLKENVQVNINAMLNPLNVSDVTETEKADGSTTTRRVIRFTNVGDAGNAAIEKAVARVACYGDKAGKSETMQFLQRLVTSGQAVKVNAIIEFRPSDGTNQKCISLSEIAAD